MNDTPYRYFNRELSWIEFNARVLEEAELSSNPLLERLRFLSIFTNNLDEFFMVRIAGLLKMRQQGLIDHNDVGNFTPNAVLAQARRRCGALLDKQYKIFNSLLKQLEDESIAILKTKDLNSKQKKLLKEYFDAMVLPVLTPLSYDAAHPFPTLANLSLYSVIVAGDEVHDRRKGVFSQICFLEIPKVLPRLIPLVDDAHSFKFIMLDDLIEENLTTLFPGVKIKQAGYVRVTRNLDYELLENEVQDLLKTIQNEMVHRELQGAVRLEYQHDMDQGLLEVLKEELQLSDESLYPINGPLSLNDFDKLCSLPSKPEHFYMPFNPRLPVVLDQQKDIFNIISEKEILVHHPFDSFYLVTEFIRTASQDPNVLAIKMTLYRSGHNSPIITFLKEAAAQGKQVTVAIELKARFDERNNISWARELEAAGVNVVYGFVNLKTHCKACLVIRKEGKKLSRYVHLSTGNYNPFTAKVYTDIGFLTDDPQLGNDVTQLFNFITGVGAFHFPQNQQVEYQDVFAESTAKLVIAPFVLRRKILGWIDREIQYAKGQKPARIVAKMNALVDKPIIEKLYEASQAGVEIELIVRGICCLRPGVKGLSENIKVRSIVDRFLEHTRIFYFYANAEEEVYLASADWMPRNMDRRLECMWPIESASLKRRLIDEILALYLADNTKARMLGSDGDYSFVKKTHDSEAVNAQQQFISLARRFGLKSLPYDKALKHDIHKNRGKRPVNKDKRKKKSSKSS